jgi:pSer/pThr/pTyr-binding forkhead associated (FHA) protein
MGKLVIKFQGKVVGEANLKLGETRIGRRPDCDVVLNDALVSGEHAVVTTVGMKSTIQDLGSKNGTFIENKRVTRHELRHGETIIVGGHALTYRDEMNLEAPAAFASAPKKPAAVPNRDHSVTTEIASFAELRVIEGKDKGKRLPLIKDTVVLDNPGKNPARISRSKHGYVLEAQIGPGEPRLNGKPVPAGGMLLEPGDVIEVADTKFQFSN